MIEFPVWVAVNRCLGRYELPLDGSVGTDFPHFDFTSNKSRDRGKPANLHSIIVWISN